MNAELDTDKTQEFRNKIIVEMERWNESKSDAKRRKLADEAIEEHLKNEDNNDEEITVSDSDIPGKPY